MKKSNKLFFAVAAVLALLLIICPEQAEISGKNTLKMCMESLIPGLFPFMVLGNLLVSCGGGRVLGRALSGITKKAFGLSGACSLPIITGLISGFPVGAAVAAEQVKNGEISAREGERVLCFCNNPGPAFILSTVAGMLGCRGNGGAILWLSMFISAVLAGLCFGRGGCENEKPAVSRAPESGAECVVSSIKKATASMVNVCGFVMFFSVVASILSSVGTSVTWLDASLARTVTGGVLETATGCFNVAETKMALHLKLPVVSMFMGWSGLSVHAQVAYAVKGSGITLKRYFGAKLMQAVTAPVITMLLLKIIPLSAPAVSVTTTDPAIITFTWTFMVTILLMGFGVIVFSSFAQSKPQAKK